MTVPERFLLLSKIEDKIVEPVRDLRNAITEACYARDGGQCVASVALLHEVRILASNVIALAEVAYNYAAGIATELLEGPGRSA